MGLRPNIQYSITPTLHFVTARGTPTASNGKNEMSGQRDADLSEIALSDITNSKDGKSLSSGWQSPGFSPLRRS
jgi:hypothetical protein